MALQVLAVAPFPRAARRCCLVLPQAFSPLRPTPLDAEQRISACCLLWQRSCGVTRHSRTPELPRVMLPGTLQPFAPFTMKERGSPCCVSTSCQCLSSAFAFSSFRSSPKNEHCQARRNKALIATVISGANQAWSTSIAGLHNLSAWCQRGQPLESSQPHSSPWLTSFI